MSHLAMCRRILVVPLVALCCAAVGPLRAQETAFQGWDRLADQSYRFDPDRSDLAPFAIQVSREVAFGFHTAEAAMKAGRWREALEPLQEIINAFPNSLHKVAEHPSRWVGAAEYARYLLASFPPEAQVIYAEWAALRTRPMLELARRQGDPAGFLGLANQWAVTPEGRLALRVLGDYALERGEIDLAARLYRRRLLFDDPPLGDTAEVALRAAAALEMMGDGQAARRISAPFAEQPVVIDGTPRPLREAVAAFAPLPRQPGWPMVGGSTDHVRLAEVDSSSFAFQRRPWTVSAFDRTSGNPYESSSARRPEFPFLATAAGDTLVLCDGLQVRAFSFLSPEPRWQYQGPIYNPQDRSATYTFEDYADSSNYRSLGSLGNAMLIAPIIAGDRVIAPLIDAQARGRTIRFDRTQITIPIPPRSLYCMDLRTGSPLWSQRRPDQDASAFVNRVTLQGAIVVGDRVIATGYVSDGAINVYAVCLSLLDGSLLWKTPILVGQQELTMFNKPFKEFTLQLPAEQDGSIYISSNLGLMASLDLFSGDLRWATEYDAIKVPGSPQYRRASERELMWLNHPPLVSDGFAVFAPLDSDHFYVVDAATGRVLWSKRCTDATNGTYTNLAGIQDGVLVACGTWGIDFYRLRDGRLLKDYPFPDRQRNPPWGLGVLADGRVYQPMRSGLLELTWSRAAPEAIGVVERQHEWQPGVAGNLLLYRDFQVLVSAGVMTVYADIDGLVRRARARVDAGSPGLEDLVQLADLEHQHDNQQGAVAVYLRALAHPALEAAAKHRVFDGLFRCHRALARTAQTAGDTAEYQRQLRSQAEYANDDHVFLRTMEELLRLTRGRDQQAFLAALDWIDRRCPDAEYPFADHQYGGLVRAALFTLDQRADAALQAGQPEAAIDAWQLVLLRFPDLAYEGGKAADHARRRIAAVIEQHGRKVFDRHDREVARLHAAALEGRDPEALARVLSAYPNASQQVTYRLDLARMLLERGDHAALFLAVSPLMSQALDTAQKAQCLTLVARAAEGAGDQELALSVWRRVRDVGADVPLVGGEGASFGSVAEREITRLGASVRARGSVVTLAARPRLAARELAIDGNDLVRIVPVVAGVDGGDLDQILLYQASSVPGAEDASLRMIDLRSMSESWRARVESFYNEDDPIVAYVFGTRLVVRQRRTLLAYDPRDGRELYRRELPTLPELVVPGNGLLYAAWQRVDGRFVIGAVELATGSSFWQRDVDIDFDDMRFGDGHLLVLGRQGRLQAFDGLTGEDQYQVSLLELSRQMEIALFEADGLLVALGNGGETSANRYKKTLVAYDLADGRRLWDLPDLLSGMTLDWLQRVPAGLLLSAASGRGSRGIHTLRLIEPRTGRIIQTIDDVGRLRLRGFDRGAGAVGRFAVLVDGDSNRSRYHPCDRLAVVDLTAGRVAHLLDLPDISQDAARYHVFATGDGALVGTVNAWPNYPRQSQTFVFVLDPELGTVEMVPMDVEGRTESSAAITRRSLVVLKEGRLRVYSAGGDR